MPGSNAGGGAQRASVLLSFVFVLAAAQPAFAQETPGVHRVKIGSIEVTALQDGEIDLPINLLQSTKPGEIKSTYGGATVVHTPVNAFLVRDGEHLVLVDSGGRSSFAGDSGHLPERLEKAGVDPADIEAVLITHLHPDHIGGLITADGKRAFPRAELRLSRAEYDYWTNPALEAQIPAARRSLLKAIQIALAPYQAEGVCRPFGPHELPFPGVTALSTSGHTPGHTIYAFGSGKDRFWAIGDIVHFGAVQFKHPEATVMLDTDQAKAAAARMELFNQAAKERVVVGAAHLPFPSMGYIVGRNEGFQWKPLP